MSMVWLGVLALAAAEYHIVPLNELEVSDEDGRWNQALNRLHSPFADGAKIGVRTNTAAWLAAAADDDRSPFAGHPQHELRLAVHAPDGGVIEGFIDLVAPTGRVHGFPFTLDPAELDDAGEQEFTKIRQAHYARLAWSTGPGVAWFRHLSGGNTPAAPWQTRGGNGLDATFEMFSGSRAVAENLALDRELLLGGQDDDAPRTPISDIAGITVRPIDWSERLAGEDAPEIDPLAMAIPADQHVLFASSTADMLDMLDWIDGDGVPVLSSFDVANPYHGLIGRYRAQLGIDMSDMIARQLPLRGVAVTGGDPYFPSGTDIAVIFDTEHPGVFHQLLLRMIRAKALAKHVTEQSLEGDGWQATAFVTPDRALSSHVARIGRFVVVANSPAQLERLGAVAAGDAEALGALDEFRSFRQRYPIGADETAFLFISDETIRRWCGPESRIGASRRARAAAALLDLTAAARDGDAPGDAFAALLGATKTTGGMVHSEHYASLAFMTPISELGITTAGTAEKTAYGQWRRGYESGWPLVFDPIAVRFTVDPGHRGIDMTVLPLTAGSDYENWIELAGKSRLSPRARAVPEGASLFLSFAVDHESELFRMFDKQLVSFLPELKFEPLSWMGDSLSIWYDNGDMGTTMPGHFMNPDHFAMMPVVLRVESVSSVRLALFLAAVRATVEQSSPGLLVWENRTHGDHTYVVVRDTGNEMMGLQLHYATPRGALLVSLDETALLRAIACEQADLPATIPAGRHVFGEITPDTWNAVSYAWGSQSGAGRMRETSWAALPVLNEWKRRHPQQDPVALHRQHFAAGIRCPGGRGYQWNAAAMTMESTTFGHPAAPRADDPPDSPLAKYPAMRASLEFEDGGLRARASMGAAGERVPSEWPNDGELLGLARDYFLNDPAITLVHEFDDMEENEAGDWQRVRNTSTERLIAPEEGSPLRVLEGVEDGDIWRSHYSLADGLRLMREVSDEDHQDFEGGLLELPAELRAGALHQSVTASSGSHDGDAFEAHQRDTFKIIGKDRVAVPAGTFEDVVKIEKSSIVVERGGEAGGGFSYSRRETLWYAKNIGLIKARTIIDGETETSELIEIKR